MPVGVGVNVGGGLMVGVALPDTEFVLVAEGEAPRDSVAVGEADAVELAEIVPDGVLKAVPVGVGVSEAVPVADAVCVAEALPLLDKVGVQEREAPTERDGGGLSDTVLLPLRVELGVSAGVPVAEGVALAFAEASAEQMTTKSDLRDELAPIKAELLVVKWMAGFTLAAVMTVLFLLVRH